MLKDILERPGYIILVGVLNLVTGFVLAVVASQFYNQQVFMGLAVLIVLNITFGVNNFAYGLRAMKLEPKAQPAQSA